MIDSISPEEAHPIAEQLYERARGLAPGAVLRALGLGRTATELLGLAVAEHVVSKNLVVCGGAQLSFQICLPLDSHQAWFASSQRLRRADLLRISYAVGMQGKQSILCIDVIEVKTWITVPDAAADAQLSATAALLKEALQPTSESQPDDAVFWRQELTQAIVSSAIRVGGIAKNFRVWGDNGIEIPSPVIDDARESLNSIDDGRYGELRIREVACHVEHGRGATDSVRITEDKLGRVLVRVDRNGLKNAFNSMRLGSSGLAAPHPVAINKAITAGLQDDSTTPTVNPNSKPSVVGTVAAPSPDTKLSLPASNIVGLGGTTNKKSDARGLGHAKLQARYQQLLDAFHEYDVKVEAPDEAAFQEGPGFWIARVRPPRRMPVARILDRLGEIKLRLDLPAEHLPRAYVSDGLVAIEIPKLEHERYSVKAENLWTGFTPMSGSFEIPVGEDIEGRPVVLDLANAPHVLIAGATNSGKSVALNTILEGLCQTYSPAEFRLHLVDPKQVELVRFEDKPHSEGSAVSFAEDAIEILKQSVEEMEVRYGLMRELHRERVRDLPSYNRQRPDRTLARRLIVLDEYADLVADEQHRREIEHLLKRLAQKGRAAGIHVIVATQRPSADIVNTAVRDNLPTRMALRVATASASRIILDEGGAEALAGRGDALLKTAQKTVRLQVALSA